LYDLSTISFLVIDEADRMIETGHFKQLEYILQSLNTFKDLKALENKSKEEIMKESREKSKLLRQYPEGNDEEEGPNEDFNEDNEEDELNEDLLMEEEEMPEEQEQEEDQLEQEPEEQEEQEEMPEEEEEQEEVEEHKEAGKKKKATRKGHQTFVFSATLTTKHVKIITKKKRVGAKISKTRHGTEVSALDKLFEMINFYHKVEVIDLTSKETVNSAITQAKVLCSEDDKVHFVTLYIYLILLRICTCIHF
jgi:FKBP-type peptidyl-prolyl cis-trans isomerase